MDTRKGFCLAVLTPMFLLAGCVPFQPSGKTWQPPPSESPITKAVPASPVTPPSPSPVKVAGVEEEQRRIAKAFSRKDYRRVVEEFNNLLRFYPAYQKEADDLYFLGYSYFSLTEYNQALKSLLEFKHRFPDDSRTSEVLILAGKSYRQLGKPGRALDLIKQAAQLTEVGSQRQKAWEEEADILASEGRFLESLRVLDRAYAAAGTEGKSRLSQAIEGIFRRMPMELLGSSVIPGDYNFPKDGAHRLYAQALEREGAFTAARSQWQVLAASGGARDEVDRAVRRLRELERRQERPTRKIGVLLPAGGKLEGYGLLVRRGIELCLEEKAGPDFPYRIEAVFKDEGEGEGVGEVVEEMVSQDKVLVLIGPLLSSSVEQVLPVAQRNFLAVFSPTASSPRLLGSSSNFFRNCLTLPALGAELVRFAMGVLELERFAILAPDDAYGRSFAEVFHREVVEQGGELVAWQSYDSDLTDFATPIQALKAAAGIPDPVPPDSPLPFEAIFLPGYADQVGMIVPQLAFHDIDVRRLTVLGGGGLNTQRFPEIGEEFAEGAIFTDGFFAGSPRLEVQNFVARYRDKFGEVPGTFTAQAYDATAIVVDIIGHGASTRKDVLTILGRVKDFPGVTGRTTLAPRGVLKRLPFFATVAKGHLVGVSSAP